MKFSVCHLLCCSWWWEFWFQFFASLWALSNSYKCLLVTPNSLWTKLSITYQSAWCLAGFIWCCFATTAGRGMDSCSTLTFSSWYSLNYIHNLVSSCLFQELNEVLKVSAAGYVYVLTWYSYKGLDDIMIPFFRVSYIFVYKQVLLSFVAVLLNGCTREACRSPFQAGVRISILVYDVLFVYLFCI